MTERKTKRKLTDINFESEGSHIALVSKEQGHGANGHHYALVMKAANFSDDFLEKASKVKVELDITEYLTRFFGVWGEDAELLARSLGFTTEGMEKAIIEQQEEMLEAGEAPERPDWETEPGDKKYEDWINYKLQSIEVMKSLYEAESIPTALSNLSEDQYLQFLVDQQTVEKALKRVEKACKDKKPVKKNSTAIAGDTSTNVDVEKSNGVTAPVVNKSKKGNTSMTKEVQTIEQEVEVIAKSQFDEIQKAFESQQVELQKALDLVKQFEQERKENIAKSRKEQLVKACGDKAEVIFKACGEASEEDFAAVVKALADMQAVIEKSALFQEQGASVESGQIQESGIAALIKSKYNNK